VAAALVRLAISGAGPEVLGRGVYDPFCGTGTIAAEAVHLGLPVFASDIDERAAELTRQRLAGERAGSAPGAADVLRHRVFATTSGAGRRGGQCRDHGGKHALG